MHQELGLAGQMHGDGAQTDVVIAALLGDTNLLQGVDAGGGQIS